jgi:membrane-associated phospholipid phosphatase
VLPHILVFAQHTSDPSFPSGDAVLAGALAAGLWPVNRRLGIVAVFAAAAMAFTCVYTGAHYTHDVLAGLALGATVSVLGFSASRPSLLRLLRRVARSRLRPLLGSTTVHELTSQ